MTTSRQRVTSILFAAEARGSTEGVGHRSFAVADLRSHEVEQGELARVA
jgi:hypothetical protein